MEFLAVEVLDLAGNEARQEAGVTQLLATPIKPTLKPTPIKPTLEPHHVQTAIRRDAVLASVFSPKEAFEVAA